MASDLTDRQKSILDVAIREYVATAEPVASAELVEHYHLAYSPATVRNELKALDEAGFLSQPHTSAGRLPTDQGYRFFINHLMSGDGIASREARLLRELREFTEPAEFIKQVSRVMAHFTHNVALAGFADDDWFYKSGIGEVMGEPEFSDTALIHEFSMLMETIEEEISRQFGGRIFGEPRVFIGAENPIRKARPYGMIIASFDTPFERESVLALIGPKRMDYEHNLALLKHVREMLTF